MPRFLVTKTVNAMVASFEFRPAWLLSKIIDSEKNCVMAVRPNFFILGAQKSGSTWLAKVLKQHDDIFVAPGEVHCFDKLHNKALGIDWYLSHFDCERSYAAIGEKMAGYLWANGSGADGHDPKVHLDLTKEFPDAGFLVVLRNPVNRAISSLVQAIKIGNLPLVWPID